MALRQSEGTDSSSRKAAASDTVTKSRKEIRESVVEALASLRVEHKLDPEHVIDAASHPESPLHSHFTWDDSEAAKKCRLDEARSLIRSVSIMVEWEDVVLRAPAYVHDPGQRHGVAGYIATEKVRRTKSDARAVLLAEIGQCAGIIERSFALAVLLKVDQQASEVLGKIREMLKQVEHG